MKRYKVFVLFLAFLLFGSTIMIYKTFQIRESIASLNLSLTELELALDEFTCVLSPTHYSNAGKNQNDD